MDYEKYGFLFQRARSLGFRIAEWIKVNAFREKMDSLIAAGSYIGENEILDAMNEVLESVGNAEFVDGIPTGLLKRYRHKLSGMIINRTIDDKFLARNVDEVYNQIMSLRKNDDYVVNPVQMDKFLDLIHWFMHRAEEFGDKVEVRDFEPKEEHGSVTATFLVLDIRGTDEVSEFARLIGVCSKVSFDLGKSGVIISCTVPNVFVRKTE